MKKASVFCAVLPALLLAGCGAEGNKASDLSVVYGVTAALSLLLLAGCAFAVKKREPWYLVLFSSVLVVNAGYFALAMSGNLSQALMANRLAYLGSVFLPLSMWMIILHVTKIRFPKWVTGLLMGMAILMFLITASPGILPVYYREVTFREIDGAGTLIKVYGPLHSLYPVYLFGYFAAMVATIVYATVQDKIRSTAYAAILAIAVFVNIGVWLAEQLVKINFEILSVSYIISECFLLGLYFLEKEKQPGADPVQEAQPEEKADPVQMELFLAGLERLTPKERALFDRYVAGIATAQIMEELNIKENTLKFHSKNLYGKLGVSSRKQLMLLHKAAKK